MKVKNVLFGLMTAILLAFTFNATAAESPYQGRQLSVSGFGTYQTSGTVSKDSVGAGVAVDYAFFKYAAVQVSSTKRNWNDGAFFENLSIAPVLRVPFGNSGFAPYALGGIGVNFQQNNQHYYFAGAGIEYRFNSHVGVFSDYIYTFDKAFTPANFKFDNNNGTIRAGLKFTF